MNERVKEPREYEPPTSAANTCYEADVTPEAVAEVRRLAEADLAKQNWKVIVGGATRERLARVIFAHDAGRPTRRSVEDAFELADALIAAGLAGKEAP